jgi:spore coat polysaccharide biosynthesis predicted glycosyltransferase SpsG
MFALCLESSHSRGMGHFFRALNFAESLSASGIKFLFVLNAHDAAVEILRRKQFAYEIVDFVQHEWEKQVIREYPIKVWINDRFSTSDDHAKLIKSANCCLVTIDDRGKGANLADIHFSPLMFGDFSEKTNSNLIQGTDYLILNREIDQYKYHRTKGQRLVISMGGSDTYGVTLRVVKILQNLKKSACIIIGPGFQHKNELNKIVSSDFIIKESVSSLIQEFSCYDMAICAGGITPFEANASGLPCLIIASEDFEIPVGQYLEKLGSSLFAGHYTHIQEDLFSQKLNIGSMSSAGLNGLTTKGSENILKKIREICLKQ